jgi:hypothetical protein
MASSDLNLNNVGFQDNLRSKPVRENFQDIQSQFNALRAEINATIASTASEITTARDNFGALVDNVHIRRVYNNRISNSTDFQVTESSPSAMSVDVTSGQGIVYGTGINATSGTILVTAPAASKRRIDTIVVDTSNAVALLSGPEVSTASAAVYPSIADTEMILAHWPITATATSIVNARIVDDRMPAIDPFLDEGNYPKAQFNYSGDTIASAWVYDQNNDIRRYKYNYSGDTISSVGVSIDTVRFVQNYNYAGATLNTISNSIG